ncbi:MAG: cytochrome P450 [Sphingomonadaceae bacterium]|nr:cytochrome P450 [Sphingomonadaceae bacterium]
MSALDAAAPYRATPGGAAGLLLAAAPYAMAALRRIAPIAGRGRFWIVTRYDDVLEVFAADQAFGVPYPANLDIITDRQPFFLGMADTPEYGAQLKRWRSLIRADDLAALGEAAEARAATIVAAAGGRVDVVDLVRRVAFALYSDFFGVPDPAPGRLAIWGSRLFEFQFTGSPDDDAWVAEARTIAAALRDHIDRVIAARRAGPARDDILGRALAAGYDATEIRTVLLCMIVGGPPQPPMVVPNAVEQLLRRADWLAAAAAAAQANDDARLHDILIEAMRFDPLAPGLKRTARADYRLAQGTPRATTIPAGSTVITAFASAMRDPRRVPEPERFDPDRLPRDFVHFGHGLHECFGRMLNHATLHRTIKPLLARNPRRAAGAEGRLRKAGAFADRLVVTCD